MLLLLGVLLFGRRLPEIGKYLGKGIVEFKKGLKGLEDDLDMSASSTPTRHEPAALEAPRPPQRVTGAAPKFEDNAGGVTPPKV
jgi:sec-independent protein translocase protein TatA